MTYDPNDFTRVQAGDVGFSQIKGIGRFPVEMGQAICGDGSVWSHVLLGVGNNTVVEARPPKARVRTISTDEDVLWYRLSLTEYQRCFIATQPYQDLRDGDIKYAWSSYLLMSMLRFGFRADSLKRRVAKGRSVQCAQLVDRYLTKSGMHVLDGVYEGEVSPGDLSFRFANDRNIIPFRLDGKSTWTRPE